MQLQIVFFSQMDQFYQPGKNTFLVHHPKCSFILPAVKEKEGND